MAEATTGSERYRLRRRDVVGAILRDRGDLLVVAGLGYPCWDVAATGDHALTFPLWGGMGSAAMIGLGLALAQPKRRVLVVTGDGEMLMGLGALATIAVQAPQNLAIAVLDNERYAETGMQRTHTADGVDLAGMAEAAGIPVTATVRDDSELDSAIPDLRSAKGPVFTVIKVRAETLPKVFPPRDGAFLKDRFRVALLGDEAVI
jgi:thiamine pyrophosphate-dependent acetolactate synthase large subunit-like protein